MTGKDDNGISDMRFSADGATWGQWEPFQTSRQYELRSGTGTRNVFVQFRDGAGRVSEAVSDDILVERKNADPMSVATSGGASLWAIVIVLLLIIIILLVVAMMAMKRRQLERAREARLRRKRMQRARVRFQRPKHGPSDKPSQSPRRTRPVRRR